MDKLISKLTLFSLLLILLIVHPVKLFEIKCMYYTYVLLSEYDNRFYVGYTSNLKQRFEKHNKGLVDSTKDRRPLKLIYFEACLSRDDAIRREKYLKKHHGRMFLKNRLKSYLTG